MRSERPPMTRTGTGADLLHEVATYHGLIRQMPNWHHSDWLRSIRWMRWYDLLPDAVASANALAADVAGIGMSAAKDDDDTARWFFLYPDSRVVARLSVLQSPITPVAWCLDLELKVS